MPVIEHKIDQHTQREEWLALRRKNINSSECYQLMGGVSFKKTYKDLMVAIFNKEDGDFEVTEKMEVGTFFEATIASYIAQKFGFEISKRDVYMEDTDLGIGSSFDYNLDGIKAGGLFPDLVSDLGKAIFEIKNVGERTFNEHWKGRPTPYVYAQTQMQMLLSGAKFVVLGVMVGGNMGYAIPVMRNEEYIEEIKSRALELHSKIRDCDFSEPFPSHFIEVEEPVDEVLCFDIELIDAVKKYNTLRAEKKVIEDEMEVYKEVIKSKVEIGKSTTVDKFEVLVTFSKGTPDRVVTKEEAEEVSRLAFESVGKLVKGTKPTERLNVKVKKEK